MNILTESAGGQKIYICNLIDHKYYTFDPGCISTTSCQCRITYIDEGDSMLLYRRFSIDQLAMHSNYLEVCYILLCGEISTYKQY